MHVVVCPDHVRRYTNPPPSSSSFGASFFVQRPTEEEEGGGGGQFPSITDRPTVGWADLRAAPSHSPPSILAAQKAREGGRSLRTLPARMGTYGKSGARCMQAPRICGSGLTECLLNSQYVLYVGDFAVSSSAVCPASSFEIEGCMPATPMYRTCILCTTPESSSRLFPNTKKRRKGRPWPEGRKSVGRSEEKKGGGHLQPEWRDEEGRGRTGKGV